MIRKWSGRLLGAILVMALADGCLLGVGAALGIGAYQWMEGTMAKDYPRTMEPTYKACVKACNTMKLTIKKESYSVMHSSIVATTPAGMNVNIELLARPNNITTVKVRFGLMGDKDQSAYFHRLVMKELGVE
jgi:hypothetical protein|uniref:DUF3568 family protein n=1 Tax=Desulfobacca acetoxidans TaxID=60893 RepID=A0A7C3YYV4_9BACT